MTNGSPGSYKVGLIATVEGFNEVLHVHVDLAGLSTKEHSCLV